VHVFADFFFARDVFFTLFFDFAAMIVPSLCLFILVCILLLLCVVTPEGK
jgi:hypothetical protein